MEYDVLDTHEEDCPADSGRHVVQIAVLLMVSFGHWVRYHAYKRGCMDLQMVL